MLYYELCIYIKLENGCNFLETLNQKIPFYQFSEYFKRQHCDAFYIFAFSLLQT